MKVHHTNLYGIYLHFENSFVKTHSTEKRTVMTVNYKFRCLESLKVMAMKQIRDYFLRREIKLHESLPLCNYSTYSSSGTTTDQDIKE